MCRVELYDLRDLREVILVIELSYLIKMSVWSLFSWSMLNRVLYAREWGVLRQK